MKLSLLSGSLGIGTAFLFSCFQHSYSDNSSNFPVSQFNQNQNNDVPIVDVQPSSKSFPRSSVMSYRSIDEWMKHELKTTKRDYINPLEHHATIDDLRRKDPKFRRMAGEVGPFEIFLLRHSIQSNVHLIVFKLTSGGRSANLYRLFLMKDGSVDPEPIKLKVLSVKSVRTQESGLRSWRYTGELEFEETMNLPSLGVDIDPKTKELLLKTGCSWGDGRVDSLTKYRYEQGQFVLSEFWQDDVEFLGCNGEPKMKRFYP